MEFKDSTIRKYLHLNTVFVKAGKEKLNVVPTGYFIDGKKTNRYTRFTVIAFWDSSVAEIKATARVSNIASCGDDDCIACDKNKKCSVCRYSLLP